MNNSSQQGKLTNGEVAEGFYNRLQDNLVLSPSVKRLLANDIKEALDAKDTQDLQSQVEKLKEENEILKAADYSALNSQEEIAKQKAEIEHLKSKLSANPNDWPEVKLQEKLDLYHSAIIKAREALIIADEVLGNEDSDWQVRLEAAGYTRQALHDLNKLGEKGV